MSDLHRRRAVASCCDESLPNRGFPASASPTVARKRLSSSCTGEQPDYLNVRDLIIGREEELTAVAHFLDVVASASHTLVLKGEHGLGRTTLEEWSRRAAEDRAYQVLSCHPTESEIALSFAALGDLLDRVDAGVLAELPEPQRRAIDVALLRERTDKPIDQRAVAAGVLGTLRILAETKPLILTIDDLHWMDTASAQVLQFAIRRLGSESVGLIATVPDGNESRVGFRLLRTIHGQRIRHLPLRPLTHDEVERLLLTRFDNTLGHSARSQVRRASGGNPFVALEMARALLGREESSGPLASLPVPQALASLVNDTLHTLSADARECLAAASALSEPSLELLHAASDGARTGLSEAIDAGLIHLDGERIHATRPLAAFVAYSTLPPLRRLQLHRRIAQVVACPEDHARHLALATIGSHPQRAAVLDEAARVAAGRGARASAAELAELARRLTPHSHRHDSLRRDLNAARYWLQAGEGRRARNILGEVTVAAKCGLFRAEALLLHAECSDDPSRSIIVLEQALAEAGDCISLRARLHEALSRHCIASGLLHRAATHAEEVLRLAQQIGDPSHIAGALMRCAEAQFLQGHGLRCDLLDQTTAQGASSSQMFPAARMLIAAGKLAEARGLLHQLRKNFAEQGKGQLLLTVLLHLADLEYRTGEWTKAAEWAQEGAWLAIRADSTVLQAWSMSRQGQVQAGLGNLDFARHLSLKALALLGQGSSNLEVTLCTNQLLGFIELSAGDAQAALRYLAPLWVRCTAAGLHEPGVLRFVPDAVETLVTLGDVAEAASLLGPFEDRSRILDRRWGLAVAARCRGLILATQGDLDGAINALLTACAHHAQVDEPLEFGRTLLAIGEVCRRAKRKHDAKEAFKRAEGTFAALGADGWAQKARSELARVVGPAAVSSGLTATESRVAELVRTGRTNPEIAQVLFISRKTVEANLTRIYAKLGVKSRAELASKLAGI